MQVAIRRNNFLIDRWHITLIVNSELIQWLYSWLHWLKSGGLEISCSWLVERTLRFSLSLAKDVCTWQRFKPSLEKSGPCMISWSCPTIDLSHLNCLICRRSFCNGCPNSNVSCCQLNRTTCIWDDKVSFMTTPNLHACGNNGVMIVSSVGSPKSSRPMKAPKPNADHICSANAAGGVIG